MMTGSGQKSAKKEKGYNGTKKNCHASTGQLQYDKG
jgi:hypothetical protein